MESLKSMSAEELSGKLEQLEKEHKALNKEASELAVKEVFSPEDEITLSKVRKNKLAKKDAIVLIKELLKN